jgi:hypothetical protein
MNTATKEALEKLTDLAQQLFNDDGNMGNLYKASPEMVRKYEGKAVDILEAT